MDSLHSLALESNRQMKTNFNFQTLTLTNFNGDAISSDAAFCKRIRLQACFCKASEVHVQDQGYRVAPS